MRSPERNERRAEGRVQRALEPLRALLRASPWTALAVRALATAFALVVLAFIGRAAARAEARAEPRAEASVDASIAIVTPQAQPAPAPAPPPTARGRATPEDPVFLNQATLEDLERLPGVGPKRAAAILAQRQRVGRFQRIEELLRVKGIGRATLRKWRTLVRLDAPRPATDGGVVQTLTVGHGA